MTKINTEFAAKIAIVNGLEMDCFGLWIWVVFLAVYTKRRPKLSKCKNIIICLPSITCVSGVLASLSIFTDTGRLSYIYTDQKLCTSDTVTVYILRTLKVRIPIPKIEHKQYIKFRKTKRKKKENKGMFVRKAMHPFCSR